MFELVCLIYGAVGSLAYASEFAYWQRKYPTLAEESYGGDMQHSMVMAAIWPISVIARFLLEKLGTFSYGLKWK